MIKKTHTDIILVDKETGVISTAYAEVASKTTRHIEPNYTKTYMHPHKIYQELDKSEIQVFLVICNLADYNNVVTLNSSVKRDILDLIGYTHMSTVTGALVKLKSKKLIASVDRGRYMINPSYSARGTYQSVLELEERFNKLLK